MSHICDCGRRFADLAGVEACQISNHGVNPLAKRVEELERVCLAVLSDLDRTDEGYNAQATVTDITYTALRAVVADRLLKGGAS